MANDEDPLDATLQIVTPENIGFDYRVAGPFLRLPALLVDYAVITAILLLTIFAFSTLGLFVTGTYVAEGIISIVWFVLQWFYGGVCEACLNGQTLGKKLLRLRTVTVEGQPIDGLQALMRNFLRLADLFLAIPVIGLFVMMLNSRRQRLGDLVAGTMVVIEERPWLMGVAKLDDPRAIQLASILPPNIVINRPLAKAISTYVERRKYFTPARRREVARHVAQPLLEKFGLPADTSYDLLLCALYYRKFIADRSDDERQLAAAMAQIRPVANPFGAPPAPGYVPPPLPQNQMAGVYFPQGGRN
jgi:uncharacterized RDD family membrane protein YckC